MSDPFQRGAVCEVGSGRVRYAGDPWSDREVGVILNPENATPRTLEVAIPALRGQMATERVTGSDPVGIRHG